MMKVVVTPQTLHPPEGRIPCVNGVMHAAINQISQNKTWKETKGSRPDEKAHQYENHGRQDQAGNGGHEQTLFVPGILMMVAVHHINNPFGAPAFRDVMKNKTMHQVFKKRPEKDTGKKYERDVRCGILQGMISIIGHQDESRHI